jgi:hypothetical protein
METKTQFFIGDNGSFYREDTTRREIIVGDELQKAFLSNITTTCRSLLELPSHGPVHMIYEHQSMTWHFSVPMQTINFRTTFKPLTKDDKYKDQLYPTFHPKDSAETPLEIEWNLGQAAASQDAVLQIRLLVQVKQDSPVRFVAVDHYLFAFDGKNAAYRLPIANLFDTCQVCMGTYDSRATTALGSVVLALRQFRAASWNADLFHSPDEIWKFVRFKALDKGFETQPIVGPWTKLCEKVAPPQVKFCLV